MIVFAAENDKRPVKGAVKKVSEKNKTAISERTVIAAFFVV